MSTIQVQKPVQIINGYVPMIPCNDCPQWAINEAMNLHGSGEQIGDLHMVLALGSHRIPPGAWIITYRYSQEEGCNDFDLYVAAKIA